MSNILLSNDLSILHHLIIKKLEKEHQIDFFDNKNKFVIVNLINDFIYENIHFKEEFKNLDAGSSWKILHGYIKSEGTADIFLRLTESLNLRVGYLNLYKNGIPQPFPVNILDLNNIDTSLSLSNLENYYLIDPNLGLNILKKRNKYLKISQLHEHALNQTPDEKNIINLISGNSNKEIVYVNNLYSEYSFINKASLYLTRSLPNYFSINLVKFGIILREDLDYNYKKYLIARLYFLMGDEKKLKKINIDENNKYSSWLNYWKYIIH